MFFDTFQSIDISYCDATYRYSKGPGNILGVFARMATELLFSKRMPSSRVMDIFNTQGKCTAVLEGKPKEFATGREYTPQVISELSFQPLPSAKPDQIIKEIDRALSIFGNSTVCAHQPDLVFVLNNKPIVLPHNPEKRAHALTEIYKHKK